MMRVLFCSINFWPHIGGVEVLAAKFLPALRERGYEYVVVAPKNHPDLPDEHSYNGIFVHRFSFYNDFNRNGMDHVMETRQKLRNLKRSFAPNLIHINAVGVENFFHVSTADAHQSPVLVTLHGKWKSRADAIVGQTLRSADWIVGCSAAILEQGRRLAPEIACRSSVIYNGVEVPSLSPAPMAFDSPRLLCLGRLAPEKGFDLALAGFGKILHRFPRARLIVAGDGPARGELERQAAEQGIRRAVEFTGWVDPEQVPALINRATLVVMPSRDDSLPLVALEAARMARPVVATRVGGIPEIVVHQETGVLVGKEDSNGLTHAIGFLLGNPEAAVAMGQAAQRRIEVAFGWKKHVDAYDALYRRLIENSPTRVI